MKFLFLIIFFFTSFLFAIDDLDRFPTDLQYYTIQIKSFPYEEKDQALMLCESLRNKNYPVYYQMKNIKGQEYWRVRIGTFQTFEQANIFAKMVREKEGFNYYVDFTEIAVENYLNLFHIVTTPQSVYYWNYKTSIELYHGALRTAARISPDGKYVVFADKHQIFKINIDTKIITKLKGKDIDADSLINPNPSWSPDGQHIAYLMYNAWELKTELWVMNKDGNNDRCIIPYDDKKQYSVKNYMWHPTENRIIFVFGYAFGTVSVGGNIYITDLKGNYYPIIESNPSSYDEIYKFFRLSADTLFYKTAHFLDDQYERREFKLYKFPLSNIIH